jgi:RHS repeat-associated protein
MSYEYDERGRMTELTYPGGGFEGLTYDSRGRLEKKTDRNGVVTSYTYDDLGRLTDKTYSDGTPSVSYTYDVAGRLVTAANGSDTLSWTYDLAGQIVSETSTANGSTVASTYDLAGNRLSVSLDGQLFASYSYDEAGRLTGITRGANVFDFVYDEVNRRTIMTYPNEVTTSYAYDDMDRLLSMEAVNAGATTITRFDYTYDAAGNRTRKQLLDYTEDYSYDALSRLTAVERTGPLTGHWHYEYDGVGNRTGYQHDATVATADYDERNQLVSAIGGGNLRVRGELDEPGSVLVNGRPARMLTGNTFEASIDAVPGTNTFAVEAIDDSGNVTTRSYEVDVTGVEADYVYDANGNLIQKNENGQTWAYEWNAENQLVRILLDDNEIQRFAYDPLGRRIEITHSAIGNALPTGMVYDGQDILRRTSGDTFSGPVPVYFIHGPGIDEPLAEQDQLGTLTFLHADGLGSIVAQSSASGELTSTFRYDAWGNIEAGAVTTYGFTGREWDGYSGLYYYRARYYDPKAGRFISEDPIGLHGGLNLYSYGANSPARFTDPSGLKITMAVEILATPPILDETCEGTPGATCVVDGKVFSLSKCTEKCNGWGFNATVRIWLQQQFSKDPSSRAPESPGLSLQQHEDLHLGDFLYWFSEDRINEVIQTEGFASEEACQIANRVFKIDVYIYILQGKAWTAGVRDSP